MSFPPGPLPPGASHSTADVARRLGVSVPTVQRWVDQGHLKAWKTVGGHRRIDAASVDAFVLGRDRTAEPPAVVIVDDNPDDRDLLAALVDAALPGARVALHDNGFDALLGLRQQAPDILFTDIVMPHMDGVQMLRHLTAQGTQAPRLVFAVSSCTPAQVAARGGLPAGVALVATPIDAGPLVARLRAAWADVASAQG